MFARDKGVDEFGPLGDRRSFLIVDEMELTNLQTVGAADTPGRRIRDVGRDWAAKPKFSTAMRSWESR